MAEQVPQLKQKISALQEKLSELEATRHEHNVVLDALSKLEPDRQCYRMVGSVLVERSVGEVNPAVKQNRDILEASIGKMAEELKNTYTQLQEIQTKLSAQSS
ncbi:hypothetical protein GEMRC1_012107 [Eukaryota sp. GEM-RC1]